MPRLAASGTKGLYKNHKCGRSAADAPTKCDCAWSGKHKGRAIVLATWSGKSVPPRTKDEAKNVLGRFVAAVDADRFDPTGERPAPGTAQTLALFIDEWNTHVAIERNHASKSTASTLGVIATGRLGGMGLKQLGAAGAVEEIEKWLNATGHARKWKPKTWNGYREVLGRVLRQAVRWDRLERNPVDRIKMKTAVQPELFKQRYLVEDVEAKLFEVVGQLNRARPASTRGKLTQEKADAIRAALATGAAGKDVAATFKVTPSVVSAIKHGDIWKGTTARLGTKGTEMERRLIGAFDGGLRVGEMLKIKLQHVGARPVTFTEADGAKVQGYVVTLPAETTKGGKTTGEPQEVYAFAPRFVQMLEARRFQLRSNPLARQFVFGTEEGREVYGFRKLWRELFELAGLEPSRASGLVWHTVRHEFISRIAENTGDPGLTQKMARHKRLETTQGYMHTRHDRLYAAARGVAGGR